MYCNKCGQKINETAKFCKNCGHELDSNDVTKEKKFLHECDKCHSTFMEKPGSTKCYKCGGVLHEKPTTELIDSSTNTLHNTTAQNSNDIKAILVWFTLVVAFWFLIADLWLLNILLVLWVKNLIFPWIAPQSSAITPVKNKGSYFGNSFRATWFDLSKRPLNLWFFGGGIVSAFGVSVAEQLYDPLAMIFVALISTFLSFYLIYKWLTRTTIKTD